MLFSYLPKYLLFQAEKLASFLRNPKIHPQTAAELAFVHQIYPREKIKKHLEIIHIIFNFGKENKIPQPLCLYGLCDAGYYSAMMGYFLTDHRDEKKRFRDEAMNFAKTAEKFEKLLPIEVVQPEIWKRAQEKLATPIVYLNHGKWDI